MSADTLVRIKRAVLAGHYAFSEKASLELEADVPHRVGYSRIHRQCRSYLQRQFRSQSPYRQHTREYLHIIQSTNLEGLMIYSKGKLVQEADIETYYFLISSKKAL